MQWIREQNLYKRPGIAETIDWAEALCALGADDLDRETVESTLGCILKYKRDIENIQGEAVKVIMEQVNQFQSGQNDSSRSTAVS